MKDRIQTENSQGELMPPKWAEHSSSAQSTCQAMWHHNAYHCHVSSDTSGVYCVHVCVTSVCVICELPSYFLRSFAFCVISDYYQVPGLQQNERSKIYTRITESITILVMMVEPGKVRLTCVASYFRLGFQWNR